MNSKQRNSKKRFQLKMAAMFSGFLSDILDDLESGKTTIEKQREELGKIKQVLSEVK